MGDMRFIRLASLSLLAATVAGACGGSDDEKITAAKLSEGVSRIIAPPAAPGAASPFCGVVL